MFFPFLADELMFGAVLVRQVVAAYLIAISFCFLRGLVVAKLRESVKSEQASTLDLFYARGNRSLERTVHAGFCNKVSNRNRPMDDAIFRLRYSTAASKHFFFLKKRSQMATLHITLASRYETFQLG